MSSAVALSKPFIRRVYQKDILELAQTMRQEDREEVFHASRKTPFAALATGMKISNTAHCIEWKGRVVAIFGVCGTKGVVGIPWMLGTDDLSRCKSLLRECREILKGYALDYPYLTNACWSRNVVHINWIKWLGFTFEGSDIRNGETFLHFHRRTNV